MAGVCASLGLGSTAGDGELRRAPHDSYQMSQMSHGHWSGWRHFATIELVPFGIWAVLANSSVKGYDMSRMSRLKAVVHNGRLTLDEPTELPEGTVVELFSSDLGEEMDEAELAELNALVAESVVRARRGELRPASELIAKMRASR